MTGPIPPTLRRATAADLPFLLAQTARLAAFPIPSWRTAAQIELSDHAILRAGLASGADDVLILIAEMPAGTPAGYVFLTSKRDYFTDEPYAHVEILVVTPDAEGQGIGPTLMAEAEQWAVGRGYRQITLNVFDGNQRARNLYHRLGYEAELIRYRKGLDPGGIDGVA